MSKRTKRKHKEDDNDPILICKALQSIKKIEQNQNKNNIIENKFVESIKPISNNEITNKNFITLMQTITSLFIKFIDEDDNKSDLKIKNIDQNIIFIKNTLSNLYKNKINIHELSKELTKIFNTYPGLERIVQGAYQGEKQIMNQNNNKDNEDEDEDDDDDDEL